VTDSTLKAQVHSQMTKAMKAGDKLSVAALRMLLAAITNKEKELLHELSDDEVREVAGREVKKRGESIEAFDAAGRVELADKERAERDVLAAFAPAQLSEEEVDGLIDQAISASGATSIREMGKVMGAVMAQSKGRVDGTVVQKKVLDKLGQ
jgi:uncharacterized protein YqeY